MLSINSYLQKPSLALLGMVQHLNFLFPDKLYLKIIYRLRMGNHLDLKNPKTFSEKLQWLKLYNHRPEFTTMVDKITAKEYAAKIIGDEYIIPTLGVWNAPEEIDWDSLPDKFVLKTNHSGGNTGVVVCKNKSKLDKQKTIDKLNKSLKLDIYKTLREWPYKNIEKKVFAEQYMEDEKTGELRDYKFFCFGGLPQYCQVVSGRQTTTSIDFFDRQWNHMPFHEPKKYPFSSYALDKPKCFDEMWNLAGCLSKGIPFLRVDFYEVNDKLYFGELTFFPTSGFGGFEPQEWDGKFGEMINLPNGI